MKNSPLCLILVFALTVAACHGTDAPPATTSEVVPPSSDSTAGWNSDAIRTAHALATAVAAGGIPCKNHSPYDFDAISKSYSRRLPVPASMTSCTGPAAEDITFDVFVDEDARDSFLATKLYVVCRSASEKRLAEMVRLPYVEGPTWLVEPDEEATADQLAKILGGVSKRGTCPDMRFVATSTTS